MLRTAAALAPHHIEATLYKGLVDLPHFNPDDDRDPIHPAVGALRTRIRRADAVLFSTPEYAGALPGSFKNLLDWTIGDGEVGSIYEKQVAWINASPRGAVNAHASLRTVLGYANAVIVEPACAHIPVTAASVGEGGLISDPVIRGLCADGFQFYRWDDETSVVIRLMTAFDTEASAVDAFLASARRHATRSATARQS